MPSKPSKAWGPIFDEHENQPGQLPKFTADDASRKTLAPVQGNGLRPRHALPGREIQRVRHACVAQPAEADWRQEVPPLCVFLLPDRHRSRCPVHPADKTNGDSTQKIHYIHGDGSECVGKEVPEDNTVPCAGRVRADVVLHGMGAGKPQYFYCTRCAYTKRAAINIDVQEFSEIKRLERMNGRTPSTTVGA
ncbi:hypothetical protein Esi_0165_0037 [Ectocarpus siliculosus]|uniref:Uncharacterized protein n=1 Tax=Ectocarpus siliculosus TaxID=2880 RepID=D8LGB1_ECTSI|nr:hypothetical protein Esi_0165_0037 [Ectocarpus siliculosus]|eukprot:CBN79010.1 hypothetical protein Esi_0165_0037 [Ectocarpus siliculosus]